jgi:hypothetical protein
VTGTGVGVLNVEGLTLAFLVDAFLAALQRGARLEKTRTVGGNWDIRNRQRGADGGRIRKYGRCTQPREKADIPGPIGLAATYLQGMFSFIPFKDLLSLRTSAVRRFF